MSKLLSCGHPVQCLGMDLAGAGCGWCADISDMKIVSNHLSRTYDYFSGGKVSKPFTLPEVVFDLANEIVQAELKGFLKEEREAKI